MFHYKDGWSSNSWLGVVTTSLTARAITHKTAIPGAEYDLMFPIT